MDGRDVSTERNTVMGVYPANGAGATCTAIPNIAPRLSVLGVPEDRERYVRRWRMDALELEERSSPEGAGGLVRTMDEWAKPRRRRQSLAALMEIVKIGESAPQKLPMAIGRCRASGCSTSSRARRPTCARTLGRARCDVLKITGKHLPNIGTRNTTPATASSLPTGPA